MELVSVFTNFSSSSKVTRTHLEQLKEVLAPTRNAKSLAKLNKEIPVLVMNLIKGVIQALTNAKKEEENVDLLVEAGLLVFQAMDKITCKLSCTWIDLAMYLFKFMTLICSHKRFILGYQIGIVLISKWWPDPLLIDDVSTDSIPTMFSEKLPLYCNVPESILSGVEKDRNFYITISTCLCTCITEIKTNLLCVFTLGVSIVPFFKSPSQYESLGKIFHNVCNSVSDSNKYRLLSIKLLLQGTAPDFLILNNTVFMHKDVSAEDLVDIAEILLRSKTTIPADLIASFARKLYIKVGPCTQVQKLCQLLCSSELEKGLCTLINKLLTLEFSAEISLSEINFTAIVLKSSGKYYELSCLILNECVLLLDHLIQIFKEKSLSDPRYVKFVEYYSYFSSFYAASIIANPKFKSLSCDAYSRFIGFTVSQCFDYYDFSFLSKINFFSTIENFNLNYREDLPNGQKVLANSVGLLLKFLRENRNVLAESFITAIFSICSKFYSSKSYDKSSLCFLFLTKVILIGLGLEYLEVFFSLDSCRKITSLVWEYSENDSKANLRILSHLQRTCFYGSYSDSESESSLNLVAMSVLIWILLANNGIPLDALIGRWCKIAKKICYKCSVVSHISPWLDVLPKTNRVKDLICGKKVSLLLGEIRNCSCSSSKLILSLELAALKPILSYSEYFELIYLNLASLEAPRSLFILSRWILMFESTLTSFDMFLELFNLLKHGNITSLIQDSSGLWLEFTSLFTISDKFSSLSGTIYGLNVEILCSWFLIFLVQDELCTNSSLQILMTTILASTSLQTFDIHKSVPWESLAHIFGMFNQTDSERFSWNNLVKYNQESEFSNLLEVHERFLYLGEFNYSFDERNYDENHLKYLKALESNDREIWCQYLSTSISDKFLIVKGNYQISLIDARDHRSSSALRHVLLALDNLLNYAIEITGVDVNCDYGDKGRLSYILSKFWKGRLDFQRISYEIILHCALCYHSIGDYIHSSYYLRLIFIPNSLNPTVALYSHDFIRLSKLECNDKDLLSYKKASRKNLIYMFKKANWLKSQHLYEETWQIYNELESRIGEISCELKSHSKLNLKFDSMSLNNFSNTVDHFTLEEVEYLSLCVLFLKDFILLCVEILLTSDLNDIKCVLFSHSLPFNQIDFVRPSFSKPNIKWEGIFDKVLTFGLPFCTFLNWKWLYVELILLKCVLVSIGKSNMITNVTKIKPRLTKLTHSVSQSEILIDDLKQYPEVIVDLFRLPLAHFLPLQLTSMLHHLSYCIILYFLLRNNSANKNEINGMFRAFLLNFPLNITSRYDENYWFSKRKKDLPEFLSLNSTLEMEYKSFAETTQNLPDSWIVVSLILSVDKRYLFVTKLKKNGRPVILKLPLFKNKATLSPKNCHAVSDNLDNYVAPIVDSPIKSFSSKEEKSKPKRNARVAPISINKSERITRSRAVEKVRDSDDEISLNRFENSLQNVDLSENNVYSNCMSKFHEIMSASYKSTHSVDSLCSNNSEDFKKSFWSTRKTLDFELQNLLSEIELKWFGAWKSIFCHHKVIDKSILFQACEQLSLIFEIPVEPEIRAPYIEVLINSVEFCSDDELLSALKYLFNQSDLDLIEKSVYQKAIDCIRVTARVAFPLSEKNPVVLVLSKELMQFPWEGMPFLLKTKQSIYRIPSFSFLRVKESRNRKLNFSKTYFILNPSNNLSRTESTFDALFRNKYGWDGVTGVPPLKEQYLNALTSNDLFIYCGHNAGEKYLKSDDMKKYLADNSKEITAVSLLIGCSSASLLYKGEYDSHGTVLSYLTSGAPLVLGNLWDVTDGDIDRFLVSLLENWIPGKRLSTISLADSIHLARESCVLKSLTGLAPVLYGLPNF